MFATSRKTRRTPDIWPGYVDALAALLMVVIFVLMIFSLAQFFLSETLHAQDRTLGRLHQRITELSELLGLEQSENEQLRESLEETSEMVATLTGERYELFGQIEELQGQVAEDQQATEGQLKKIASLQQDVASLQKVRRELERRVGQLVTALQWKDETLGNLRDRSQVLEARLADAEERTLLAQQTVDNQDIRIRELLAIVAENEQVLQEERELSQEAQAQVAYLNRQIDALREQLTVIAEALQVAEQRNETQQAEIKELGRRLNIALARKVNELERYRSEFFGRVRKILGDDPNIRVTGDRFTFQSELLFASGSAELGRVGERQLVRLADTLKEITERMPSDLDWVLRVDGHTDRVPIRSSNFRSNWELSTARALSVVRFLAAQGVPEKRLAAVGFGEFHPLDPADTSEAYRRNRRIEIKLTTR